MAGMATLLMLGPVAPSSAAKLWVGAATASITPDRPVALYGHAGRRIAQETKWPLMATAMVLEAREGDDVVGQACTVSCDLLLIPDVLLNEVRARAKQRMPDFDVDKVFLSATHTHSAPVMREGRYILPEKGVMRPAQYVDFAAERISDAIVKAWESRRPGGVSWGLGHAVVARNRRAVYADGRARMYGATGCPDFRHIEGYEDHGVEVLFFWDERKRLTAVAVNVACPAQQVEGLSKISADYWHPVRERLRERYGEDLCVLGWCGAAGDQSPHLMYRKLAEHRMREGRGLNCLGEIARRIVAAVDEAYAVAREDIRADAAFAHSVKPITLPRDMLTEEEYEAAKKIYAAFQAGKQKGDVRRLKTRKIDPHEEQDTDYTLRLESRCFGDVVRSFKIMTDDFREALGFFVGA